MGRETGSTSDFHVLIGNHQPLTKDSRAMTFLRNAVCSLVCVAVGALSAYAQSRGVYPLGMSTVNSGLTPEPGFSCANQLLFYSQGSAKDDDGNTLPVTGHNGVLMDLNSFVRVGGKEVLGGARYSASATLPIAKNELVLFLGGLTARLQEIAKRGSWRSARNPIENGRYPALRECRGGKWKPTRD